MKTALFGLAALLTLSAPAKADDTIQYWWTLVGDVKLDDNDTLTGAVIIRSRPDTLEPGQRFLRTGISHRLQNGISLSVGYTHVTTLNDNAPNSVQHRGSQGIGFPVGKIADSPVDVRFQAEEIFIPGRRDIGVRGRGRVRLLKPLDAAGAVDVQLSDELIWSINSTDWGQKSGWAANRAALALHFKLNKRIGLGPGYTWQLINRTSGQNRNDHILGLNADVHF
jgi:Protein of unknown function (DUF2490)